MERPCIAHAQRVDLPDGDILLPFSTIKENLGWDTIYWSGSVRIRLDGDSVNVIGVNNLLSQSKLHGFVEPSMTTYNGTYYMSLRANDGYAYITTSKDGLSWEKPQRGIGMTASPN